MEKSRPYKTWIFQIISAIIFIVVAVLKLSGHAADVYIFETLGMEPAGRYFIAIVELLAGLLLLTNSLAATGAFIGIGVMLGALITHLTILGFEVNNDGGATMVMLGVVLFSCIVVAYMRRKQIPFIGSTFN